MEGPRPKKTKESPKKTSELQGEHQVPKPAPVTRSISNMERRGPPERTPSLEEPSPTATAHLKV
jgi:hypothetical protein